MTQAAKQIDVCIGGVPPEHLFAVWHIVEPILRRAVTYETGTTTDQVLTSLQLCKMQLWVVGDFLGVVVTSIEARPTQRVLFTHFLAGDEISLWVDEWIELSEQFARDNECEAVEFAGRKGWMRFLRTDHPEYKPVRTIMRRELT